MNQAFRIGAGSAPFEAPVSSSPQSGAIASLKSWFGARAPRCPEALSPEAKFYGERPEVQIDRLWQRTDRNMYTDSLSQKTAMMVGFDVENLVALRNELRKLGISPVASCASASQIEDIGKFRLSFDLLFVNLDGFSDVSDGVDALISYRMNRPEATVILVSHLVSGDDLSAERRAICDATLRAPISSDRLRTGILGAMDNFEDRRGAGPERLRVF